MTKAYPDYFNDVFGPIMQPFSSAHTAGPCRMGFIANCILGEEPADIKILIDPASSWNATFGLQNEDLAFLSGCTGHLPHDAILFQMREYCKKHDISYEFVFETLTESKHHSAAKFILTGRSGKRIEIVDQSLGGGLVATTSIEGYPLDVRGDDYVLLVFDKNCTLDHEAMKAVLVKDLELIEDGVSQKEGAGCMHWFKTADEPSAEHRAAMGSRTELILPVTTVITHNDKKPQLFTTMIEWRELAEAQGKSLFDIAVEYEMNSSGWSREEVIAYMRDVIRVKMHRATHAIYEENITLKKTPFSTENHLLWSNYCNSHQPLCGDTIANVLHYAYAAMTGIPGVEFIPGPMGSGGGLIYSVLYGVKEARGYSDEDLLRGLFIAAGVGAICFTRSEPGGGNVGCMGEMGMCGAMAAAAVTEMVGGTARQVETSAAMAMMLSVGWPCDPTSGAKTNPCGVRGLMMVSMAPVFADISMSGRDQVFPFHEVLDVADTVGRDMPPQHRACKYAGHSGSPTGRACIEAFLKWHETL
ncbi:MAG: L-serine ammonia-lyase, iron-sulfur-dependent, subunit alpha [Firmicutes bacterium]|nr:L-serine ammonia-lyase, iron-sulfur-dependent, subunit alpha [Bacillota bacterium]